VDVATTVDNRVILLYVVFYVQLVETKLTCSSAPAQLQLDQVQFQVVEVLEVDEEDSVGDLFHVVDSLADQDLQLATSVEDQTTLLAIVRPKQ